MNEDVFTEERQRWLKSLQSVIPLCYQRNANGSFKWRYTPVAKQSATYLADKFRAMGLRCR